MKSGSYRNKKRTARAFTR